MTVKKKDPAAVALGRRGGKKGGPARAAKLTPEQRSASARKAVQARWARAKQGSDHTVLKRTDKDARKAAKSDSELRRLTEELQKIVFHKQYQNA
jgi:hypothetical protein